MNSNRFTAMYRPQSSSKKYDTISAASYWENRSKAGLLQALEIICFRYFKKEEGSKATLDLWSNNRTYENKKQPATTQKLPKTSHIRVFFT